jgi:LysR family hydrogen peroxide-inducible transcriptional activator
MFWRKSSAMHGFLLELAQVFKNLPRGLLDPATLPASGPATIVKKPRGRYVADKARRNN